VSRGRVYSLGRLLSAAAEIGVLVTAMREPTPLTVHRQVRSGSSHSLPAVCYPDSCHCCARARSWALATVRLGKSCCAAAFVARSTPTR